MVSTEASGPKGIGSSKKLIHKSGLETVREIAADAFNDINECPAIQENPFYTWRELTPLNGVNFAIADYLSNREISEEFDLVTLLFNSDERVRKLAEKVLLRRGEKISSPVLDAVSFLKAPISKELLNILGKYKDPRAAGLIVNYLKSRYDFSKYDPIWKKAIEESGNIASIDVQVLGNQYLLNFQARQFLLKNST